MNSLSPKSYQIALERAKRRPSKPRTPLTRKSPLKGNSVQGGEKGVQRAVAQRKHTLGATKAGKKKKKLTDGKLKNLVWKQFSIFTRTQGCDESGFRFCFTCEVYAHWKDLQAGHFIRGRLNANLFDERGCKPQCYICNIHRQGNVVIYYRRMLALYGQEVIDELLAQNERTKKWAGGELAGLLEKYSALNKLNPLVETK